MTNAQARVIFRCRSKVCKAAFARTYTIEVKRRDYAGRVTSADFLSDDGWTGWPAPDCPKCGSQYCTARIVHGIKGVQPCDDRCAYATGTNCECECAGENHGKGVEYDKTHAS